MSDRVITDELSLPILVERPEGSGVSEVHYDVNGNPYIKREDGSEVYISIGNDGQIVYKDSPWQLPPETPPALVEAHAPTFLAGDAAPRLTAAPLTPETPELKAEKPTPSSPLSENGENAEDRSDTNFQLPPTDEAPLESSAIFTPIPPLAKESKPNEESEPKWWLISQRSPEGARTKPATASDSLPPAGRFKSPFSLSETQPPKGSGKLSLPLLPAPRPAAAASLANKDPKSIPTPTSQSSASPKPTSKKLPSSKSLPNKPILESFSDPKLPVRSIFRRAASAICTRQFWAGAAAGAGTRALLLHFGAAALATTLPGVAGAVLTTAAVGAVAGGVTKLVRTSFDRKQTKERNWAWKAFRQGAVTGAFGGAVGGSLHMLHETHALHLMGEWVHRFTHKLQSLWPSHSPAVPTHLAPSPVAPRPVAPMRAVPSMPEPTSPVSSSPPASPPAPAASPSSPPPVAPPSPTIPTPPPSTPPPSGPAPVAPSVPATPTLQNSSVLPAASENSDAFSIEKFVHSDEYEKLPHWVQKLAHANASNDYTVHFNNLHDQMLFIKEASFDLRGDKPLSAHLLEIGLKLIKEQHSNLKDLTSVEKMILADRAYVEGYGIGTPENLNEAAELAKLSRPAIHDFGERFLKEHGLN